jgi:phosphomannomutase
MPTSSSTLDPANINAIFKAYDVRGTVPDQVDEELARRTGAAFVQVVGAETIVIGHDMRPSSPGLADAFATGAAHAGADVVHIGLASTDGLYFASGHLGHPGAMFTASHNPAEYNGIKLCRAGAQPVGMESGLAEIRDAVLAGDPPGSERQGSITHVDLLAEYVAHLLSLAPVTGRRLTVVVDAGNGMASYTAPAVFDALGAARAVVVPMYFELDGSFPHHEANPIEPENLRDLQARVVAEGADIGLAFDGDADRCFVVDEQGRPVSPSTLTALIAARELRRVPGANVIHNLITSRAVPEIVTELGGTPVRTRVGHSFIKATMAETDAVFGGEHSGHFYFRDFWRADSGMLAALHTLSALAATDRPLSELAAEYERYVVSGEINSTVDDQAARIADVEKAYAGRDGTSVDHLDGLTINFPDGSWANLRPSNTEPLLRLNVEAPTGVGMAHLRDEILALVRG